MRVRKETEKRGREQNDGEKRDTEREEMDSESRGETVGEEREAQSEKRWRVQNDMRGRQ